MNIAKALILCLLCLGCSGIQEVIVKKISRPDADMAVFPGPITEYHCPNCNSTGWDYLGSEKTCARIIVYVENGLWYINDPNYTFSYFRCRTCGLKVKETCQYGQCSIRRLIDDDECPW